MTEPSAVESSVGTGTAACSVADDMQTEEPIPSDVQLPSDQDVFLSVETDAEAWQAPPRRRKRHKQKAVPSFDDDDDALLNAAVTSVTPTSSLIRSIIYSRPSAESAWSVLVILGAP